MLLIIVVMHLKKIIFILFVISMAFISFHKDSEILIPGEAIRFRVIANSNTLQDQTEKMMIKEQVEKEVYELIHDASNTSEVRDIIKNNMSMIESIVSDYQVPYEINYGNNYFPAKSYRGVVYPAGNYESLVITLGNGAGNNFWCVLFPPLCLLENSNEDISDLDYQLYVKKLLQGSKY